MAKRFAGFTPEQMGKIIPEMQGMQADEQAMFLASKPGASASERLAKMAKAAEKRINMAYGGYVKRQGYATGGTPSGAPAPTVYKNDYSTKAKVDAWKAQSEPGGIHYESNGQKAVEAAKAAADAKAAGKAAADIIGGPALPPDNNLGTSPVERPLPAYDPQTELDEAQAGIVSANKAVEASKAAQAADPTNEALVKAVAAAEAVAATAKRRAGSAYSNFKTTEIPTTAEFTNKALNDPGSLTKTADVATITDEDKKAGTITAGTGQAGSAPEAVAGEATLASDVAAPVATDTVTYDALSVEATTQDVLNRLEAATGKPSEEALVDAQSMSPEELAQLGINAAQISEAQRVEAVAPRTVQAGEMIEGSTVDMGRVKSETNFEAATGAPSKDATVQGQLTGLLEQFERGATPAWAAGAMRAATATLAARGLGASSMAGQAIIQAAMESALPIAQLDAQTSATFELTNLSNRQATAMFAAEKRAEFLGLEFNQSFQTRVANSAKISEIANINFTADQQVALENARMAQSVDLSNLSASNAKVLADAAAMTQTDLANLNNRQQAQVQNAKSFLDMDIQNLSNEQQTAIFKTQSATNALLSDQSAANAALQFNASSENQTNQFFSNLSAQVSMFNNEQTNAMNQFNTGETNAVEKFNATQKAAREQFNANSGLIVAQANAAWSQATTTAETAAQNQANRDAAMTENEYTMTAYNNVIQEERDLVSYAFSAAQGGADREARLTVAAIQAETTLTGIQAQIDTAAGQGSGKIMAIVADKLLDWALS